MKQFQLYITRKNGVAELLFESDSINACKGYLSFGSYSSQIGDTFQIMKGTETIESYIVKGSEVYA